MSTGRNPFAERELVWAPDGRGLPESVLEDVTRRRVRVHLRLSAPGRYPRGACGRGLGEWWTGRASEVTCSACLERVPS